jgi:hypothetical protein
MRNLSVLAICALSSACGGAAPLMHPAHAMDAGDVTMGAGFSGVVPVAPAAIAVEDVAARSLEEGAMSPGLAPWVGGRVGLDGSFDAGLTYTGRSARLDIRRAIEFGAPALSVGIGASGLLPKRHDELGLRVGGFGADVPVLLGYQSAADIYSAWIGARGGFELLSGQRDLEPDSQDPSASLAEDLSGWHVQAGGLVGLRVGFRYVFAVLELGAAMHWAEGEVGDTQTAVQQFNLSPAGALVGQF